MKHDLSATLEIFRVDDEAAYVRTLVTNLAKLKQADQIELLAYFVFALMDKWEAEESHEARVRQVIDSMLAQAEAKHEPRQ